MKSKFIGELKSQRKPAAKRFDTTQCRRSQFGSIVHRDYFAHCFRWGWASRHIKPGSRVLDVGCGQDAALASVLWRNKAFVVDESSRYVGVDMNTVIQPLTAVGKWCTLIPAFDFTSRFRELGLFDVIVNFEVIEHMEVEDGERLLIAMRECLGDDGVLILSTPVLDEKRGQAKNHIHEYKIQELNDLVVKCGFIVEKRFGTFASYNEIKKALTESEDRVFESVRAFYGDDVTACFFAPLYADASRNNVWMLRKKQ